MYVFVLNADGTPVMPTKRCGKVRRMLKEGTAKVIKNNPFTIQLVEQIENNQSVSLGVDEGYKTIGLSATTPDTVYFEAECSLRQDGKKGITGLLRTRRTLRSSRRNRKLRYRPCRIDNRRKVAIEFRKKSKTKHKKKNIHVYSQKDKQWINGRNLRGRKPVANNKDATTKWIAPTPRAKIDAHLSLIDKIVSILPVDTIRLEGAMFDTQLLQALESGKEIPKGKDYQCGETAGFWNARAYVLDRDKHTCQNCKGKSKDNILEVHHIKRRQDGGTNRVANLVTLCKTCHDGHHQGKIKLDAKLTKPQAEYKAPTFMGIARMQIYQALKKKYPDKNIAMTYGFVTKNLRIENNLPKEHYIDARCISGNPNAKSDGKIYVMRKIRCHNRQLQKANPVKLKKETRQQRGLQGNAFVSAAVKYAMGGIHAYDKVRYNGNVGFVTSRSVNGKTVGVEVRTFDGEILTKSKAGKRSKVIAKKVKVLAQQRGWLVDIKSV